MTIKEFLCLHEHGIPVPQYALNFIRRTRGNIKPLARVRTVFGDRSRLTLLVGFPGKSDYCENLSLQDAMERGRFFEKDKGFDVLYIEYVPVLWYMSLMLTHNGSGEFQIIKDRKLEEERIFVDYARLEDVRKRAMCRFSERLFGVEKDSKSVTAVIGWSGCFFGEPASRFLVKEYKL